MKRLIRWALNHVPRPLLQRLAGWAVPVAGLFYVGRGRECPVCGARRRRFLPYGYVAPRADALCPSCLSLERHRLLWLYLTRETDLLRRPQRILHIAPEVCLMKRLRHRAADYTTADLESPLAELHFDVLRIPLPDASYDVLICNHLLEHVADDRRALGEFYRILRPGGWGILLSPVDRSRAATFEDDSITDPAERTRIFGQYDHRRIYGRDYGGRLREAGFEVREIDYAARFSAEERRSTAHIDRSVGKSPFAPSRLLLRFARRTRCEQLFGIRDAVLLRLRVGAVAAASHGNVNSTSMRYQPACVA